MQEMNLRATTAGRGAFLACIAGARNEYLTPLYAKPAEHNVRSRNEFQTLTLRLAASVASSFVRRIGDSELAKTSTLLYELFKNTDDHATADEFGRPYSWTNPNIRGVLAKFISAAQPAQLAAASAGDTALNIFLARSLLNKEHVANDPPGVQAYVRKCLS